MKFRLVEQACTCSTMRSWGCFMLHAHFKQLHLGGECFPPGPRTCTCRLCAFAMESTLNEAPTGRACLRLIHGAKAFELAVTTADADELETVIVEQDLQCGVVFSGDGFKLFNSAKEKMEITYAMTALLKGMTASEMATFVQLEMPSDDDIQETVCHDESVGATSRLIVSGCVEIHSRCPAARRRASVSSFKNNPSTHWL